MENHKEKWRWPVDLARYDRSPALSRREKEQIAYLATRHVGSGAGPWPEGCKAALRRLIQPVREVLDRATKGVQFRYHAIRALLKEMHRRGRSYWSWSDEEWLATVGPTNKDFLCRHACKVVTHRQPIFAIAYLLGGFKDFDGFPPHGVEIASLADSVFGREVMKAAVDTTFGTLHEWGYNNSMREKIRTALSYLFLTNRSPSLNDLSLDFLASVDSKGRSTYGLPQLYAISRALTHLKIIPQPLPRGAVKPPGSRDWTRTELPPSGWTGVSPGTSRAGRHRGPGNTAFSSCFRLADGWHTLIQQSQSRSIGTTVSPLTSFPPSMK
jgi:hypothetical protein